MSWLTDNIDKSDQTSSDVKRINNKITPKYYEEFPSDIEGGDGDVRYVYQNGRPFICIKMNARWHFQSLKTIGENGAYRSDAGELTGSAFETPMQQDPNYDTGWRQLLGVIPDGDDFDINEAVVMNNGSGGIHGGVDAFYFTVTEGQYFQCIGYQEEQFFLYDQLMSQYYPAYKLNHGLGLTRPPINIMAYASSAPPSEGMTVDTEPGPGRVNCLTTPPEEGDIVPNSLAGINQTFSGQARTWNMPAGTGTYNPSQNLPNIMPVGLNSKTLQTTQSIMGEGSIGSSGNFAINAHIVSPNHIAFCPNWNHQAWTSYNQNEITQPTHRYEWLRIYIWR